MQYMGADPRREYLKQSVMSASPAELIAMLFDGCIKDLKLARICYEDRRDIPGTSNNLLKAQRIIGELLSCLDMTMELSTKLLPIYEFLMDKIREINVKKDMSQIPSIIEILESMRDTWREVAKEQRKNLVMESC